MLGGEGDIVKGTEVNEKNKLTVYTSISKNNQVVGTSKKVYGPTRGYVTFCIFLFQNKTDTNADMYFSRSHGMVRCKRHKRHKQYKQHKFAKLGTIGSNKGHRERGTHKETGKNNVGTGPSAPARRAIKWNVKGGFVSMVLFLLI